MTFNTRKSKSQSPETVDWTCSGKPHFPPKYMLPLASSVWATGDKTGDDPHRFSDIWQESGNQRDCSISPGVCSHNTSSIWPRLNGGRVGRVKKILQPVETDFPLFPRPSTYEAVCRHATSVTDSADIRKPKLRDNSFFKLLLRSVPCGAFFFFCGFFYVEEVLSSNQSNLILTLLIP